MSLYSRLLRLEGMSDSKGRSESIESCLASAYMKLGIDPLTMHAEAIEQGFESPAEAVGVGLRMTVKEFKADLQAIAGRQPGG